MCSSQFLGNSSLIILPPPMRFIKLLSIFALLGTISAQAASVTIVNPGFETDAATAQAGGGWSDNVPTGWGDPDGNSNTNFIETITGFASEGITHVGFDPNENGIIYQDLSTAWSPNTKYTLTVGVGRRAGFGAGTGLFGLTSTNDGAVVSNDLFSLAAFAQTVDTGLIATVDGTFADMTLTFTTGAVAPTGNIRLFVKDVSATRIHVDNFRLDAVAVPEPAAALTAVLGAGLLLRRRRRV